MHKIFRKLAFGSLAAVTVGSVFAWIAYVVLGLDLEAMRASFWLGVVTTSINVVAVDRVFPEPKNG
jgi:hypothetical protein